MKKLSVKIVGILLCAVCALSLLGCNGGGGSADYQKSPAEYAPGTTHIYNVSDSAYRLVSGGTSDYTIVYPASATDTDMALAVSELRTFVEEGTGAMLPARTDAQHTGTEKIISLGATAQMSGNQTLTAKLQGTDLGANGFIVYTLGDSVYIMGNTSCAVLWGVYEFLYRELNYSYYAENCYSLDTGVRDLTLKQFDITDVPDIQYRVTGNGDDMIDRVHLRRMRYNVYADAYNAEGIGFAHNYYDFLPRDTYYAQHPEWYSTDGTQLCFTRDFEGLKNEVVKLIIEKLEADPTKNYIPFMHNDGGLWCQCSSCQADRSLYDSEGANNTAVLIRFMNAVAKEVKAWNLEECPERDIKIVFFSYGAISMPPVVMDENKVPVVDENGNYTAYSDEYILEDNLVVQVCGFGNDVCDIHSTNSESDYQRIARWRAVCDQFFFWCYSTTFSNYMIPFNCVETRGELYEFMYGQGAELIFDNAQYGTAYSSDFGTFKSYIYSQMMWNVRGDLDQLIENFFNNYYGEAAPAMKKMYSEYRSYMKYLYEVKNLGYYIHGAAQYATAEAWPYQRIQGFLSCIDEAFAAIEPLQSSDPDRYETLHTRILREEITYRYLELYIYPGTFSTDAYSAAMNQLLLDCYTAGITEGAEHVSIAEFLS